MSSKCVRCLCTGQLVIDICKENVIGEKPKKGAVGLR